jgi:hypothetical protein
MYPSSPFSVHILYTTVCVKNRGLFKTNFDVHKFNTRSNYDLHLPTAKLTVFQKRSLLFGYQNL